jgi:hypothetical protein
MADNAYELAPDPEPRKPAGDLSSQGSLLRDDEIACPRCGKPMGPGAVVCLSCGFDMKANAVRTVEMGEEHAPDEPERLSPEHRPGVRTLLIVGGVAIAIAMVLGGWIGFNGNGGIGHGLGRALLAAYEGAVYTGVGVVAMLIAARMLDLKLGRLDLAAARMLVCVGAALIVLQVRIDIALLGPILISVLGVAVYGAAVLVLFRADYQRVMTIAGLHLLLLGVLQAGSLLSGWVAATAPKVP